MKKTGNVIKHFIFISMLAFSQIVTAETDNASGLSGIEEAKKLYAQAVPMDIQSPKRAEILDQAAEILKDVIKQHPESLDAHRKLMGVYLLKQDYSNAIRTMQDAITLSPEDPKLFISLAFLYEHSGSLDFSKAMLDQALSLDPENKIAQDYSVIIQQKIDIRNQDEHQGKDVTGTMQGKKMPADHGKDMGSAHPPASTGHK